VPGSAFDLAVIGGGINGCGVARDAAGRGLSVLLAEQGDLGGATSSASTKLIHGGLRYLEHYEFRLVREALMEREVLLRNAPHIIWPLRFVLPHHKGLRPWWLLRVGLFLYDHLGGRRILPPTKSLDLSRDAAGAPLKPGYARAFEYSDCWVEDSRLVVLNAVDAAARGASIRPRTRCVAAERDGALWRVTLRAQGSEAVETITARALVNAAGPWVGEVLAGAIRANTAPQVRLVKGSHIVTRRLFAHDRAYIFQNADGRIVFAIPYERDFTLIGTTDEDYKGDPGAVAISEREIDYLRRAASEYFRAPVERDAVVWSYSGVRPLYDDGASKAQEATRDYVLELEAPDGRAPLLTVFGGKITTYRRLAEAVMERLAPQLGATRPWTGGAALPGGDFAWDGAGALAAELRAEHPHLGTGLAQRLVRAYGTRARMVVAGTRSAADLGRVFGADLTEREVLYLMAHEWAATAADVLWRRSKLGLRLSPEQARALDTFMSDARAAAPAA
jgi:glycerol-3-phosphate dehydrogenase